MTHSIRVTFVVILFLFSCLLLIIGAIVSLPSLLLLTAAKQGIAEANKLLKRSLKSPV